MADAIPQDTRRLTTQRPQAMADTLLGIIAQAATDPRVDIVKMTALLDMQERIMAKAAEAEFNAALANLNKDDLRVAKEGTVKDKDGDIKYKFAKWEDMDAVIRPLMRENGFTISFDTAPNPNGPGLIITGTLLHQGGHSRTASIPLTIDTGQLRNNLQAMGSTVSYGKRYVTEMLLNIVRQDDDDDGQSGGAAPVPSQRVRQPDPKVYDAETWKQEKPPMEQTFAERAEISLNAEKNGTRWLKVLDAALAQAQNLDDIGNIRAVDSFKFTMANAPTLIKQQIEDMVSKAVARVSPQFNGNGNGKHEATPEPEVKTVADALKAEKNDDPNELGREFLPGDP